MQQHNEDGGAKVAQMDDERRARREFLKQTGKAAVAVPAMALLLKAEKASASFSNVYGDRTESAVTFSGSVDAQTTATAIGVEEVTPKRDSYLSQSYKFGTTSSYK